MAALVILAVSLVGGFVAIVMAQAALNRAVKRSEDAGRWGGPIARALMPGKAFEVGVPWKAVALVVALVVGVFVVVPRIGAGPADASASGQDCREVTVLTPDHPAGVVVEHCGPLPVRAGLSGRAV